MRVVVITDAVGELSSADAGRVLAHAWGARGADVAVLPAGEAGGGFLAATAARHGLTVDVGLDGRSVVSRAGDATVGLVRVEDPAPADALPLRRSSLPLGRAVAELLDGVRPARLLVDLTGAPVHDGGAGLLAGLGATADRPLDGGVSGLTGLSRLDLGPARARLAGVELVGVVPPAELDRPLLGLRGITSLRGRETGLDPAVLLRVDADLEVLAGLVTPAHAVTAGAGACGGLGLAVLALGGTLRTGAALSLDGADLRGADLVVTGCTVFDFGSRGGGVVAEAARRAADVLAPCVVLAGEVLIGSREMRTLGIEAGYAVREPGLDAPSGAVTAAELAAAARRVARSWSW